MKLTLDLGDARTALIRSWMFATIRLTRHQRGAHSLLLSRSGNARDGKWVSAQDVTYEGWGRWSMPVWLAQEKGFI